VVHFTAYSNDVHFDVSRDKWSKVQNRSKTPVFFLHYSSCISLPFAYSTREEVCEWMLPQPLANCFLIKKPFTSRIGKSGITTQNILEYIETAPRYAQLLYSRFYRESGHRPLFSYHNDSRVLFVCNGWPGVAYLLYHVLFCPLCNKWAWIYIVYIASR